MEPKNKNENILPIPCNIDIMKVTVLKNCMDDPKEIAETLAERTRSQVVQVIGRKIILYKESKENKKIILP